MRDSRVEVWLNCPSVLISKSERTENGSSEEGCQEEGARQKGSDEEGREEGSREDCPCAEAINPHLSFQDLWKERCRQVRSFFDLSNSGSRGKCPRWPQRGNLRDGWFCQESFPGFTGLGRNKALVSRRKVCGIYESKMPRRTPDKRWNLRVSIYRNSDRMMQDGPR